LYHSQAFLIYSNFRLSSLQHSQSAMHLHLVCLSAIPSFNWISLHTMQPMLPPQLAPLLNVWLYFLVQVHIPWSFTMILMPTSNRHSVLLVKTLEHHLHYILNVFRFLTFHWFYSRKFIWENLQPRSQIT
jgi:hypothetical protein